MLLEVSVANQDALWRLKQFLKGESQNALLGFYSIPTLHLQTSYFPIEKQL